MADALELSDDFPSFGKAFLATPCQSSGATVRWDAQHGWCANSRYTILTNTYRQIWELIGIRHRRYANNAVNSECCATTRIHHTESSKGTCQAIAAAVSQSDRFSSSSLSSKAATKSAAVVPAAAADHLR